jgi:hypothetical protein
MTRRLLEYGDDLNDVLRSALDAEKSSPVSADADAARLAKIGAGIAERIGAPPPPPQPPSNPPPGHAAPVASGLASKAPFVLLAAAAIVGLVAIGSMSNDKPAPAMAPVAKTVETAAPIAEPPPSTPGISLNDLPSVPSKTTAAKPAARPTTTAEAPTQEEIALIDRAHQTLRNDPQSALALCKEHETKFASGHFAQEREAVAIEALVYLNRKDEAKRRFSDFDNKYPSSSHRVHLESLLAR